MKFDLKYPDFSNGYMINTKDGNIQKREESVCERCKEKTQWFNDLFGKYLCSEECTDAEWIKYWRE